MFEEYKNPKKIGPGLWFLIHSAAWRSKKREDKIFFCKLIYQLAEDIRCSKCQSHFKEYLKKNPPELCYAIKDNDKYPWLFKWTFEFHNSVNERTGKKKLEFEELINFFLIKDEVCYDCA